jgi:hypothetical protein
MACRETASGRGVTFRQFGPTPMVSANSVLAGSGAIGAAANSINGLAAGVTTLGSATSVAQIIELTFKRDATAALDTVTFQEATIQVVRQ